MESTKYTIAIMYHLWIESSRIITYAPFFLKKIWSLLLKDIICTTDWSSKCLKVRHLFERISRWIRSFVLGRCIWVILSFEIMHWFKHFDSTSDSMLAKRYLQSKSDSSITLTLGLKELHMSIDIHGLECSPLLRKRSQILII